MAYVTPMAETIMAMAVVSAMSTSMGAAGFIGGAGGIQSAGKKLDELNVRILRLSYKLENQRSAVLGHRKHMVKLMQKYGYIVVPSVSEMSKHPDLKMTEYFLRKSEKDLERMEVRMTLLQKQRKDLQVGMGIREKEPEPHRTYTAMKKFVPPTERRY